MLGIYIWIQTPPGSAEGELRSLQGQASRKVFILHTPLAAPLSPEDNAHLEGPLSTRTPRAVGLSDEPRGQSVSCTCQLFAFWLESLFSREDLACKSIIGDGQKQRSPGGSADHTQAGTQPVSQQALPRHPV